MNRISLNLDLLCWGSGILRGGVGAILLLMGGCDLVGGDQLAASRQRELEEFQRAGQVVFHIDHERINKARKPIGPYRVGCGDLLKLQMPATVRSVSADLAETGRIDRIETFLSRVNDKGDIALPIVGELPIKGLTLPEIESSIQQLYYPRYVVSPPVVVTQIEEYHKPQVTITGAVVKSGRYALRRDQMTLVTALMEAGGILETGAAVIRIHPAGQDILGNDSPSDSNPIRLVPTVSPEEPNTPQDNNILILPVKGLNIPFADVLLNEGDTIEVEGIGNHVFTIVGLVNKQGTYPYPPGMSYHLPEAIAFAGGLNDTADPRFARIYRPTPDGRVLDVLIPIRPGAEFAAAMTLLIRPGDVVAVDQTPRTRRNLALSELFSLRTSVGVTYTP
jgi:protein involved in polysaccharide export with SLBB domain